MTNNKDKNENKRISERKSSNNNNNNYISR